MTSAAWQQALADIDAPAPPRAAGGTGLTFFGSIQIYDIESVPRTGPRARQGDVNTKVNIEIDPLGSDYPAKIANVYTWTKKFRELIGPSLVRNGLLSDDPSRFLGTWVRFRKVGLGGVYYVPRTPAETTHAWVVDEDTGDGSWQRVPNGTGTHCFYTDGDEGYYAPKDGNTERCTWRKVDGKWTKVEQGQGTHFESTTLIIEEVYPNAGAAYAAYVAFCEERGIEPAEMPPADDDFGTPVPQQRPPSAFAPPAVPPPAPKRVAAPPPSAPAQTTAPASDDVNPDDLAAAPASDDVNPDDLAAAVDLLPTIWEAVNGESGKATKPNAVSQFIERIGKNRICMKARLTGDSPEVIAFLSDKSRRSGSSR